MAIDIMEDSWDNSGILVGMLVGILVGGKKDITVSIDYGLVHL